MVSYSTRPESFGMSLLRVENLGRRNLSACQLDNINLTLSEGECLALVGEADGSRDALLRIIAGLEQSDEGRILLDGQDITRLPPRRRRVGHLIHQDRLMGHATVFDCIAACLPSAELGPLSSEGLARARHVLSVLGLSADAGSMPAMLPPGKRRRLQLGRVIATEPRVLLVSAGFGSSQAAGSGAVAPRVWLRRLQQELGLAMILSAVSAQEATLLADRVAVMHEGRLIPRSNQALATQPPAQPGSARHRQADRDPTIPALEPQIVASALGTPARVLGVTVLGACVRLDLELVTDGSVIEATLPGLGFGSAITPGSLVGVRWRHPPDAFARRSSELN